VAATAARAGATVVRGMFESALARFGKCGGDFATADRQTHAAPLDMIRSQAPPCR
jgi:myo-inositol-1(or 4)-monophosphatase